MRRGVKITAIDRESRRVVLRDGEVIGYDHLGLTTDADAVDTQAPAPSALVVQAFRRGVPVGVEAMNAPAQFVRARRVLSGTSNVTYERARALDWSLERYAESVRAATE